MAERRHDVVLSLPGKLAEAVEQENTRWFVFQLLDKQKDWRESLTGARLSLAGPSSALKAPSVEDGLGLQVDEEAAPPHMLVLKPHADGSNAVLPAGRISACIKIGSLLPKNDDLGRDKANIVKLVPLDVGETIHHAPLAYWRLGPSILEDSHLKTLSFKCTTTDVRSRQGELIGGFAAAPKMQLIGRPKKLNGATYLVGGVVQDSRKMLLYEAEVYWVERNTEFGRNKADEQRQEAEERKALDFGSQRAAAIALAGAAQKRRQEASKELRIVDDSKVAALDECLSELNSRATGFKDMNEIKENDANAIRRHLLPAFDQSATEPAKVYAAGLEQMLPARLLAGEAALLDNAMTAILQRPSRIRSVDRNQLQDVFKSSFSAYLAHVRAEAAPDREESCDAAELTAKRFVALNLLIKLYRINKPRFKILEFQELLGLPDDSRLSKHLFNYLLAESPTDRRQKKLEKRKLACHIIVLVLDLSLKYEIDFHPLQEELGVESSEMLDNLRYAGCEYKKSTADGAPSVTGKLSAPLVFQQPKGAGRGNKRKR